MKNNRRRGREAALQILCAADAGATPAPDAALKAYFTHLAAGQGGDSDSDPGLVLDAADREAAEGLVRGTLAARADLDKRLGEISRTWRVDRMSIVDRNILRLGLYELRSGGPELPARIVINEAIELAKRYGTEESAAFVNAILDGTLKAGV